MKLTKKHYITALCLIILTVFLAMMNTFQPIILQNIINKIGNKDSSIINYFLLYFFSIVLILLIELSRKITESRYSSNLKYYFREKITANILTSRPREFSKHLPQEYISVINNDVPTVVEDYYLRICELIFQVVAIVLSCTALTQIYFPLAAVSISVSITIALLPLCFKTILQTKKETSLQSLGKFNVKLSDVVFGHSEIRIQQISKAIENITNMFSKKNIDETYSFEKSRAYTEIIIGAISFVGSFSIIVLGGYRVFQGKMDIGSLFAAIQLSDLLIQPVIGASISLSSIVSTKKIQKNLSDYFSANEALNEQVPADFSIETISFENVTIKYGDKVILKNFTQTFEKNKKYIVFGSNGSGKSSLINLISNNIEYSDANVLGKVLVNGKNRNNFDDKNIFKKLSIVTQTPFIFSGTVNQNISLFNTIDISSIDCLLDSLQENDMNDLIWDNRELSNDSAKVSAGQREKIALLRELIKENEWIILDEAMAALDKKSKTMFEKFILNKKDLSVIHISHDYDEEKIKQYDEIIMLDTLYK